MEVLSPWTPAGERRAPMWRLLQTTNRSRSGIDFPLHQWWLQRSHPLVMLTRVKNHLQRIVGTKREKAGEYLHVSEWGFSSSVMLKNALQHFCPCRNPQYRTFYSRSFQTFNVSAVGSLKYWCFDFIAVTQCQMFSDSSSGGNKCSTVSRPAPLVVACSICCELLPSLLATWTTPQFLF